MKRIIFLLVLAFFSYQTKAQYTEIINSKRPGFSESPYSIGTDVFQFEFGLFSEKSKNNSPNFDKSIFGGELFFRYGKFFEKLEFNASIAYQNNDIKNDFNLNYKGSGISKLTVGAKYLIREQKYTDKSKEIRSWKRKMAFDKKRLIPSIGVYAGVNTNFVDEVHKDEGISFKGAVLLQNDFSNRFVVLTNLIADKISSDNSFYSHIITATYAVNYKWSFFIENQGFYSKNYSPKYHIGGGLAYLFNKNLQFDASVRTMVLNDNSFTYSSIGAAWRLDRHSDEIINKNAPDNPLRGKKTKKRRKKRGNFFSRLFKKKN